MVLFLLALLPLTSTMSSPEIALKQSTNLSADVIVVGAGLTGALAATLLAWQGVHVILVDRTAEYPPRFKAEKLEPDQIEMLRRFGQMERLLPRTGHIENIWEAQNGRVIHVRKREQYGIFYQDIVNGIRAALPQEVKFRLGSVQRISCSGELRSVTLEDGEEHFARLVVLATASKPAAQPVGNDEAPHPAGPIGRTRLYNRIGRRRRISVRCGHLLPGWLWREACIPVAVSHRYSDAREPVCILVRK